MSQVINTNVPSLNAQRNLNTSQGQLTTSLQRLSSGLRINSAKDDAAGLAISERFTTQIRGLNQAVRNANDGISLAQTGEGGLQEIQNNLQRIRELAVQSANATNSPSDRAAIDREVQQRIAEVERIASQTTFNGQRILDGTFGDAQFQVGANVGDTISVSLSTGVRSNQIGQIAQGTGSAVTADALAEGGMTIQIGTSGSPVSVRGSAAYATTINGQESDSAFAKAEAIKATGIAGLTVSASTEVSAEFTNVVVASGYEFSVNGTVIYDGSDDFSGGDTLTRAAFIDRVNLSASETGVRAEADGASNVKFVASDGRNITIAQAGATGVAAGAVTTTRGSITLSASEAISIAGAGGTGAAAAGFTAGGTIAVDNVTLASVDVKTVENSNDAILRIDSALTSISSLRSDFGAIQNRFESTIANLSTTVENLSASRSRIMDTDFAAETANLTRAQILQQAGVAMLAQANALPQNVLSLLR